MKTSDSAHNGWQMFSWAMLGGLLMIVGSVVQKLADPNPALRIVLALLPVPPLAAMTWSIARAIGHMDEMQRRIHLETMTSAFVATAFVVVIYGQLQHARIGLPELNWAFVYPVQLVAWIIAYVVILRRYL